MSIVNIKMSISKISDPNLKIIIIFVSLQLDTSGIGVKTKFTIDLNPIRDRILFTHLFV